MAKSGQSTVAFDARLQVEAESLVGQPVLLTGSLEQVTEDDSDEPVYHPRQDPETVHQRANSRSERLTGRPVLCQR